MKKIGLLYNDELTFTSDIYVQKQSFGIANENVVSNVRYYSL